MLVSDGKVLEAEYTQGSQEAGPARLSRYRPDFGTYPVAIPIPTITR